MKNSVNHAVALSQVLAVAPTGSFRGTISAKKILFKALRRFYPTSQTILRAFMLDHAEEMEAQILSYQFQILRNLEPLRPNKNKVRKRRLIRGTERHSPEKNYRRAF